MPWRTLPCLMALTSLVGCAAPETAPPPAPVSSTPIPLPHYVTHAPEPMLGGAAWRTGGRVHALALDGQVCGLTRQGDIRCQAPEVGSRPASPPRPAPGG